MAEAGAYGGVAMSEAQAAIAAGAARLGVEAAGVKKSILEGTVELSTLGLIGSAAMLVVSVMELLGNLVTLSPVRALLMVYCFGGAFALCTLEAIHAAPAALPAALATRLRVSKLRLRAECHILTTLTGRALGYAFFGSILLADSASWLGGAVGFYLLFVGFAMLYVSKSAVAKLKDLAATTADADLDAKFTARAGSDGALAPADFGGLCADLGTDMTPREVAMAAALLDADGSGAIERDEFLAWWSGANWQKSLYGLV